MSESYKLIYFNKRGGGEIIRLVFVAAGREYEDNRLDNEEWMKIKKDMPMRNLPCLQILKDQTSTIYCQSGAIAKYLSRKFGLYLDEADDNLRIEEIYDSVGDVRSAIVQIHFCQDDATKKTLELKLVTETIPKFVDLFKMRQSEFGNDGFVIGKQLTLADLAVFNMVDSCTEMGLGSLWQKYEELIKHREKIMKIENIAEWLTKRPKTEV